MPKVTTEMMVTELIKQRICPGNTDSCSWRKSRPWMICAVCWDEHDPSEIRSKYAEVERENNG